jgi:hypothetical protein
MILMIMISTYLNHLNKSAFAVLPFNLKSAIAHLQSLRHIVHFRFFTAGHYWCVFSFIK